MTEQQKQVFWKTITFGAMACGTLLVLGLATLSVLSGAELDFAEAATPASVIFAAVILGRRRETPPKASGGPTLPLGGAALLLLILPALGCGAAQCETERGLVNAATLGVDAAGGILGDSASEEISIARGVTELGAAAVSACEVLRDGGGWQQWVGLALEAVTGLLGIITGAADGDADGDAPPELLEAIDLLEASQ